MNDSPALPANPALAQGKPSSWRDWLSVYSVALGAFAFVTTEYLPVGVLPSISSSLGITDGVAGLMVTVPGIVAAIAAPAIMLGAGRMNRRQLLLLLTLLQLIANLVTPLKTVPRHIQVRQLVHFFKADPDYGARVAAGLGISAGEVDGQNAA